MTEDSICVAVCFQEMAQAEMQLSTLRLDCKNYAEEATEHRRECQALRITIKDQDGEFQRVRQAHSVLQSQRFVHAGGSWYEVLMVRAHS